MLTALYSSFEYTIYSSHRFVKQAAIEAINEDYNQYSRPGGHPTFVQAIAKLYSPFLERDIDCMTEIVTFSGAQGGITAIVSALMNRVRRMLIELHKAS